MKTSIATLTTLLLFSPASVVLGDGFVKVSAAPIGTNSIQQKRSLASPIRRVAIAQSPPPGAKATNAISFNTSLQWKNNPKSRTVFAIDNNQRIWFIDPTSGWPYTLDSQGVVYTANALNGIVYSLGLLRRWQGSIPYFFQNWSYVAGAYVVPSLALYSAIYWNPTYASISYYESYAEVWQYENYFDSPEFRSEVIDIPENNAVDDSIESSDADALNGKFDTNKGETNDQSIEDNKPLDLPNGIGEQNAGNSNSQSYDNNTMQEPSNGGVGNGGFDSGFGGGGFESGFGGGGFDGGFGGGSGGGDGGGL